MFIHLHKEYMPNYSFLRDYTEMILETFHFSNYHLINFRHCVMLARKTLLKLKKSHT